MECICDPQIKANCKSLQLKQKEMNQQSIYNIIPKQFPPAPQQRLYRSKFPPSIPPTSTTFCLSTTSKPIGSNLAGQFNLGLQAHTEYGSTKTFGHLNGDRKPSTHEFLKMRTGTMGNDNLPPVRNFSYDCRHKKDPVPCVYDKPVQGQRSNKNFIVSNAIENILSMAKRAPEPVDWLKKKQYGETPAYLNAIKQNINSQYRMIQNLQAQNQQRKSCLTEEEVTQLREGLKKKWNEINKEYQKLTYIRVVDTIGLKNRKEAYERQLALIEADIKKLNKNFIFVQ